MNSYVLVTYTKHLKYFSTTGHLKALWKAEKWQSYKHFRELHPISSLANILRSSVDMEKCFLRSTLAKRTCRSKTYHHLKVWGREQATRGTALIDLRRISCSGWYVAENSLVYNKVVSWPPMKWVQMSRTPRICARRAVTTGYSPKSRWQRIIRYLQVKRGNVDGKRNLDKKMHDVQFVRFFLCSHFCTHCYQHGTRSTCNLLYDGNLINRVNKI